MEKIHEKCLNTVFVSLVNNNDFIKIPLIVFFEIRNIIVLLSIFRYCLVTQQIKIKLGKIITSMNTWNRVLHMISWKILVIEKIMEWSRL